VQKEERDVETNFTFIITLMNGNLKFMRCRKKRGRCKKK